MTAVTAYICANSEGAVLGVEKLMHVLATKQWMVHTYSCPRAPSIEIFAELAPYI